jgi:hypothetical protein
MSLVREDGNVIIAQFTTPLRGTWKNIAIHSVPNDALYDSNNVFIRQGKLRSRPGLVKYDETDFHSNVLGGMFVTTPTDQLVLAVTYGAVYQLSSHTGGWSAVTLSAGDTPSLAEDNDDIIDLAQIETSSVYAVIIACKGRLLRWWKSSPRSVSTITGTNIPKAKSVCIAASRVVALVSPHTIVWSETLDPTVFNSLAVVKRAQTGDMGICVRSLNSLSFALYKERSIHVARAQAGNNEGAAFGFREPIIVEGPAGMHAVVAFNGIHVYMTRNGRIGLFDGSSQVKWICDGLWFYLQNDIKQSDSEHIRGVYDYRLHTITFFYPKVGHITPGVLRGMVVLNLPFEGQDIAEVPTPRAFLGVCHKSVTHACEMRFKHSIDRSLIFTSALRTEELTNAFLYDENTTLDDGVPFDSSFQTGMVAMPDARHMPVTVETFAERGIGYGSVLVEPVISDSLETRNGTIPSQSGQWVDLEVNPIREYKGFGRPVRFFGLRYSWRSDNRFRYSGSVVYGSNLQKYRK